ncbi:maltose ABC transporter permease MalF [Actinobacillus equuli subsp. equuli]|uniref:Maltose/maltodextrin transport system permease protein n=1 Tax=Actinobacillus equuli subsp. equuli TaxID=202947 RepID=A0A9X4G3V5_ACTEU|nr:maltose ABC transporter permease MalF [Actinobacillus equuli]MDE8034160.1 maltose ABC transporter permease MalF [Actinobacillus equuli subsp. equuli]WGE55193.1 maltose ABC transporter permease MalF [Actinobacillus equuli subsp. equuli]WGE57270.1 maltose ABC transporter permease MalF [Actinobacillus equuli subsp. equuli]WGE65471.1 maltose ABC transporter permease MalF [Actinobacillus equuli subsp. equuli]WGE67546.1 maltose ABC transporter permease MalF [Actinobacillus equuli subsp. haemolyti
MQALKTVTPSQSWAKRLFIGLLYLLSFYLVFTIYLQGEILFALLVLVVVTAGIYIFSNRSTYHWRYVYPGVAAMGIFVLFPLICTVVIAFTNYSGSNQLSFEQVLRNLQSQTYAAGERLDFKLIEANNNQYQIALTSKESQKNYLSDPLVLNDLASEITVNEVEQFPAGNIAPLKAITQNRQNLQSVKLVLPTEQKLTMSSLRQFAEQKARYTYDENREILTNNETQERYKANDEIGFFQKIDAQNNFIDSRLEPGYTVTTGWHNFIKILTDDGVQEPFIKIFIWTVVFALLTVIFTTLLGMIFASLVQWEALQGKAIYRLLLILPYAVPGFISILVFKGLFNQSFGEINLILNQLFGIRPEWFNDPFLAKAMLLIVNTWLGYPYMMIVCMGLLKAIPHDLYEASAIDGASVWQNFTKITMPLLIKPLMPLMIASFAFNFNNFVLIQLLTNGGPNMVGTTTPAGHTDLLVSYTYRIAFEGSGTQDFGLAAAIAVIIFLLVSGLALFQIRMTKLSQD